MRFAAGIPLLGVSAAGGLAALGADTALLRRVDSLVAPSNRRYR
jgi:hypothetical protein